MPKKPFVRVCTDPLRSREAELPLQGRPLPSAAGESGGAGYLHLPHPPVRHRLSPRQRQVCCASFYIIMIVVVIIIIVLVMIITIFSIIFIIIMI